MGDAFVEDPVRLLRLARFAARFDDFSIAPETLSLARRLVADGEVDALVPERVWREMVKALEARQPGRMFLVLQSVQALDRVLPGLVFNDAVAARLQCAAGNGLGIAASFALLCSLSPHPEQIGKHLRAPSECIDYARLLPLVLQAVAKPEPACMPQAWLDLIEQCDGLRKPDRFLDLIGAARCIAGHVDAQAWQRRLQTVRGIDAGAIAKAQQGRPQAIKAALRQARLAALSDSF